MPSSSPRRSAPPGFDPAPPETTAGASPGPNGRLSLEPDHLFSFAELWPVIQAASRTHQVDGRVIAGICRQESGFRNWRVHRDGTGHGLFGLDDNGLLPDFERWTGVQVGRGYRADIIAPELQIEYACYQMARYTAKFGDPYTAARAWHRGERLMWDQLGANYEALIRAHVRALFG